MRKVDFSKLPVGTSVWSIFWGWGTIIEKRSEGKFPIIVLFEDNVSKTSFTVDGRLFGEHKYPTLFLNEFTPPPEAYVPPGDNRAVDSVNGPGDLIRGRTYLIGGLTIKRSYYANPVEVVVLNIANEYIKLSFGDKNAFWYAMQDISWDFAYLINVDSG